MKKMIYFLAVVVATTLFFACPATSNNSETSNQEQEQGQGQGQTPSQELDIEALAGTAKTTAQLGTLVQKFPNNVSNTFTGDPQMTRTITWQSSVATGEVIIDGDEKNYPSTSTLNSSWYYHRVDITGLAAGETYSFIAGTTDAYSPVYSFTTASASLNDFYVLHVTDPQIGTGTNAGDATVWKRVIETAVAKFPDPAFIVNTGDMVDNSNAATISFYFDYAQKTMAEYAFVYSIGNNDTTAWYNRYFYTSDNNTGNGVVYSFDYGNVHFVNVDSNVSLTSAQLTWLENDLKNTTKKWKVVMMHEADYGRSGTNSAKTKLFDTYNVDLVMAGHNHFYARSKPINTAGADKVNGTVWTIPNAAGTKFNDAANASRTYLAVNKQPNLPMFSKIRFTADNIYLEAYTVNTAGTATQFDTYTWR